MGETRTYIVPEGRSLSGNNDLATMALLSNGGGFGGNNGMWNNPLTLN